MPKELVSKSLIATTPALAILKAYRIANKRAGEAKIALAALPDTDDETTDTERTRLQNVYKGYCDKLKELSTKAEALPAPETFHVWCNFNGKTGHTYPRDYKATSPNDNNYERHVHELEQMQAAVSNELGEGVDGNDDSENDMLN